MFLFQLVYILFLNDIQVRRLSFMGGLRLRQLWPVNMKSCRPDALEGLKRKYGYPPDMQELATETVIKQAEMIADELMQALY
jgi:hypothetical protein